MRRLLIATLVAGLTVSLVLAAYLLLSPTGRAPSDLVLRVEAGLRDRGAPAWLWAGSRVEFVLNVVAFAVPVLLGWALLALLAPRRVLRVVHRQRWWLVLAVTCAGILASTLIELAQRWVLPQRSPTAIDVVANSLGALLGALGGVACVALVLARSRGGRAPEAVRTSG